MVSKYRNKTTEVDGITFASAKEARRYSELKILQKAGVIHTLRLQPVFPLVVNKVQVAKYIADFDYVDAKSGSRVVEDVKSAVTRKLPVYRLKVKILAAMGMAVVEV